MDPQSELSSQRSVLAASIKSGLDAKLRDGVAVPVRERLAYWLQTSKYEVSGASQKDSFVEFTIEKLNYGNLNIGQAIAFVEAMQAAETTFLRASFLSSAEFNPYFVAPVKRN